MSPRPCRAAALGMKIMSRSGSLVPSLNTHMPRVIGSFSGKELGQFFTTYRNGL
jgi:hypothetical protein